jgi:hypothetical protein
MSVPNVVSNDYLLWKAGIIGLNTSVGYWQQAFE